MSASFHARRWQPSSVQSSHRMLFSIVRCLCTLLLIGAFVPLSATATATDPPEAPRDRFGVPQQGLHVVASTVERNQTFAELLLEYGVSYQAIVTLARTTRDVFDVRDIQSGKPYRVYKTSTGRARYLVYRPDAVRYVVYNVQNPERSRVGERPVTLRWKIVEGTIQRSLYESLQQNDAPIMLALQLSEVFAWQVDFFRLQPGDRYRIVYEEQRVDGRPIGSGAIVAATMQHRDTTYTGFRFDEGNGPEYFDKEGNSLQRQLLKAPLRFTRISSGFSHRRLHPVLKAYRPPLGTDYAAPTGTPVRSVGDGRVEFAAYKGANGNYVKIHHNSVYSTGYLHLSRIAEGVRPGANVKQGDIIGYVGSTGRSTGPHLDYRVWKHGTPVNPLTIDSPPTRPVQAEFRDEYEQHVSAFRPMLGLPSTLPVLSQRFSKTDALLHL